MNRIFLISLLYLVNISISAAQTDFPNLKSNKVVTTIAYFNKNDVKKYHVKTANRKFKNESTKPYSEEICEYDITISVIDSTEKGYTLIMKYSNFSTTEIKKGKKEYDHMIDRINEKFTIKYTINELGQYDTVLNYDEIGRSLSLYVNNIKVKAGSEIKTDKERKEFDAKINSFDSILHKPENIEALFIDDIIHIHFLYGSELELNKENKIDIEFMALESFPLPGVGTITLKNIDKSKDECKISVVEKPDKNATKDYLKTIMALFIEPEEMKKVNESDFSYNGTIKYTHVMSLSTGWMKKIKFENTTTIMQGKKNYKSVVTTEFVSQ